MYVNLRTSSRSRNWAITAVTFGSLAAASWSPVVAQDGAPDATAWAVPRTPYGHPDLQGNWTNATLTPVERPEGVAPVLSQEQVAQIERGQAAAVVEGATPSDPNRPPPPAGGTYPVCIDTATGCYNEVYREPGERVAVVDGAPRSSLVTNPADGRVPALTPEGQRRIEDRAELRSRFGPHDHPELLPLAQRCLVSFGSNAGPPMLPNYWYNNNYTIVQNADHVMIMTEMVHDARIIKLGERRPLPAHIRPWLGDSWGRWEGDTLVVETTNLPRKQLNGNANFAGGSDDFTVTERFTRVDETTINYEFTVEDPTFYSSPWTAQVPFKAMPDLVYEYACHEANYALSNVLSGARAQEREATDVGGEPR